MSYCFTLQVPSHSRASNLRSRAAPGLTWEPEQSERYTVARDGLHAPNTLCLMVFIYVVSNYIGLYNISLYMFYVGYVLVSNGLPWLFILGSG